MFCRCCSELNIFCDETRRRLREDIELFIKYLVTLFKVRKKQTHRLLPRSRGCGQDLLCPNSGSELEEKHVDERRRFRDIK